MPSFKTVAVPPNPTTKRGGRLAAAKAVDLDVEDGDEPISRRPAPPRPVKATPIHRYRIGERLNMSQGGYSVVRSGAFCKVVATLPYEGHGSLLYRVRSERESFDRVVSEADLNR